MCWVYWQWAEQWHCTCTLVSCKFLLQMNCIITVILYKSLFYALMHWLRHLSYFLNDNMWLYFFILKVDGEIWFCKVKNMQTLRHILFCCFLWPVTLLKMWYFFISGELVVTLVNLSYLAYMSTDFGRHTFSYNSPATSNTIHTSISCSFPYSFKRRLIAQLINN